VHERRLRHDGCGQLLHGGLLYPRGRVRRDVLQRRWRVRLPHQRDPVRAAVLQQRGAYHEHLQRLGHVHHVNGDLPWRGQV
jgi:hypothetical protein